MVMMAVAIIILTMLVTTAEVVAFPTAEALLPHCIPRKHPAIDMRIPNTKLLNRPMLMVVRVKAPFVSL
jgi:hypothetical protein